MLEAILLLLELIAIGEETVETVTEILDLLGLLPDRDYSDLTLEEKTELLKECTKIVANLQLDLACFPLGYTTTILFDLEGNPLP